ncbi:MAG TPA: ABC transporter permease [Pyrinomonadaceae bacterium]|nr:ABC transporter permease [Pyrinomonadaceae bacterium]
MGISTTDGARALESTTETGKADHPLNLQTSSYSLPDEPLVTIEPTRSWLPLNFGDLWTYRELLYFLTWRDIKVRYKQTAMGIAWVVMQPLLMTLIFTVFLGMLARVPTGGLPYPLLIFTGLLPWNLFSSGVGAATYSLVGNSNLITKVYFPRVLVPAASIAARLVDFAISFAILAGILAYYRLARHYDIALTWNLAAIPFLIALTTLLSFGLGMLVSALNVKYRDVGVALPVVIQLGMFVSPVLYPLGIVPGKWQRLYALNPLVGVIDGFRTALLGGRFNQFALAVSVSFTIGLLIISAYIFRRFEKEFADFV